jgi:MFS family permease
MRNATTRLTALVATLAFLDLVLWLVIVPLLPTLEEEAGLSKGEAGVVLAAYSAAVLIASIPVGHLADRVGPRRMTIATTFLFAALAPTMALADDFWSLVAIRFGQGLFSAVSWTAGLAWLTSSVSAAHRGRSLATVSTVAATAPMFGPVLGGPVTSAIGLGPLLVGVGIAGRAVAIWALRERGRGTDPRAAPPAEDEPRAGRREVARAALREPYLRAALVSITIAASTAGAIQLLAPLHLDDEGVSEASIGWIFTVSAMVALTATLTTRRVADRIDRLRTVARMTTIVACIVAVPLVFSLPVPAYVVMLVAIQTAQAPIWVLAYPLCSDGAERARIGQGLALGALNTVWAVGALASPAIAGGIAQAFGDRAAYVLVITVLLCGLTALVHAGRQARAQPPSRTASSSAEVTG